MGVGTDGEWGPEGEWPHVSRSGAVYTVTCDGRKRVVDFEGLRLEFDVSEFTAIKGVGGLRWTGEVVSAKEP